MQAIRLASIAAVASLLVAGCIPLQPPTPALLPSPSGNWTVRLVQSGGFVGVQLTIQVSSTGEMQAEDQRAGRQVAKTLPPETVAEVSRLLSQTTIPAAPPQPSACADCFVYDLEVSVPGGTYRIHADDVSVADSGAQALILYLARLRDSVLKGTP